MLSYLGRVEERWGGEDKRRVGEEKRRGRVRGIGWAAWLGEGCYGGSAIGSCSRTCARSVAVLWPLQQVLAASEFHSTLGPL